MNSFLIIVNLICAVIMATIFIFTGDINKIVLALFNMSVAIFIRQGEMK